MKYRFKPTVANIRFIFNFILLSILIVAGGYSYYNNQSNLIREKAESELTSIALLKVSELTQWRNERLGDGKVIMESPFLRRSLIKTSRRGDHV